MSASPANRTLSRQWEILKLLPGRSTGIPAADITQRLNDQGFRCSIRTVQRDMNELSVIFPIVCNDKSIPFGWSWAEHASLDMPGVSAAEALSLCMVEQSIKPLLPASVMEVMTARFNQAKNKLNSLVGSSHLSDWTTKVASVQPTMEQLAPSIEAEVLEIIQNGLLRNEQLAVAYHPINKEKVKEYVLNPLGLVQRGVIMYLVASIEPYTDTRLLAVHRLKSAERTSIAAQTPPGFSLQKYLDDGGLQFTSGRTLELHARLHKKTAQHLEECPLSEDQRLIYSENGETAEVRATVCDTWQLRWWVLSLGNFVEVLGPTQLRQDIVDNLTSALKQYT